MKQKIDEELWQEFETEQKKIIDFDINKLQLTAEDNQILDIFFKKFLDPAENFPEGSRHNIIEKNFAIYIVKNKIDLEQIKKSYEAKGYNINSLLSQIGGVMKGTYKEAHINIGELVNWCKKFRSDLIELFKTEEEEKLPVIYDKDLRNYEVPDEEYLLDNEYIKIPKGEAGLITGKSFTRKTFLILYSAVEMSQNGKKVFIIDEETGYREIKKRINSIKKGLGIENKDLDIAYLSFYNMKLDKEDKQKLIKKFLNEFKPDIIFVDGFQRVLSFNLDKENQLISNFMTDVIRPLMVEYGNFSWCFTQHYRKTPQGKKIDEWLDEIRGGSELVNYCRFIYALHKPKRQDNEAEEQIVVKQLKLSNAPPTKDKVISFISNGDSVKLEYIGVAEEVLATEQQCANAIMEWILEQGIKGEFKTKDVQEAEPGGFKTTTITAALKVLIEDKRLIKVKRGVYRISDKHIQTKIK